jgi:hypothetical protein
MGERDGSYQRYLFTVRLWPDEPEAGQTDWRGLVQCANDGERRAFHDWPELVAFLVAKLQEFRKDNEKRV